LWCLPEISATEEVEVGGSRISDQSMQSYQADISKSNANKRAWGAAQVVECLASMHEALGLISSITYTQKKGKRKSTIE
jgi:hypothetical protein